MAYTARLGELYLIKNIPWGKDYKHTKYFSSASAQFSYITDSSRLIGSSNPKTAQNQIKDPLSGTIKIAGHQENYLGCSYICFKNTPIDGSLPADHTYNYAFVDNVRFTSSAVFEIDYTIDVFQTYLFQGGCTVKKAFIRRTHTQTDVKGEHLEPEPVSFSDYKLEKLSSLIVNTDFTWVVYAPFDVANPPTPDPDTEAYPVKMSGMAGGVLQGLQARAYTSYTNMISDIENMDSRLAEKIVGIVAMPAGFVQAGGVLGVIQPNNKTEGTLVPSGIDGYTPLNNKLWTAPFNTMLLSNTHGGNRTLKFEYFDSSTPQFRLVLGIAPNPELLCAPIGYGRGFSGSNDTNYAEAISITDFPHTAWTGNGFLAWFGTTGQHQIVNTVGSLLNPISWLNPIGTVENMAHTAIDATNAAMTSAKSYGSTGGSVALMAAGAVNFYTYQQCINSEDAKRIDHFFSRYGYAINRIDDVHFTNPRFNQHYIQTNEVMISGGAPAAVIKAMSDAFNSGITFWKNEVGAYTLPPNA